MTQVFL